MRPFSLGGVLLMTLVVLGVFLVIMISAVGLVNRQFKEIVNQEQEEQAFQIAEAGISYALWLLDNGLVDFDGPEPVTDYSVTDHTQDPEEIIGSFDIDFEILSYSVTGGTAAIRVTSMGKDAVLTGRRQTVAAEIYSDDLDEYKVVRWDHLP